MCFWPQLEELAEHLIDNLLGRSACEILYRPQLEVWTLGRDKRDFKRPLQTCLI